uniref:Uncharacterized protein n=1 Tax=Arion vulgaris TaxID=1028688 RepID=A0A0B7BH17_9EUPU
MVGDCVQELDTIVTSAHTREAQQQTGLRLMSSSLAMDVYYDYRYQAGAARH